jgi:hypothetical protein
VPRCRIRHAVTLLLALTTPASASQRYDQPAAGGRSPRNANYDIDVTLDHAARTLRGRERITWRNISTQTASEVRLHLYWNAWRNERSTFMREQRLAGGGATPRTDGWSSIDITALRVRVGAGDVADATSRVAFIAPDDGNISDRTVATVPLPAPVGPNEVAVIDVDWTAMIPRTFARTGYRGRYYFIGQWFPKIGVLEDQGWNVHQFHAATEFYADYGVYDVRIVTPGGFVVGATGIEASSTARSDGTTVHRFHAEDVHDFAWVASPRLVVRERRVEMAGLPPVRLRLFLQPEHLWQEPRFVASASAALTEYGRWYGPYPYGQLTIVDAAYRSGSGGMEYPMLVTAGTRWLSPAAGAEPESTVVHEVGHQFWYGLVGSNEVEHAWMDEGVNQFSESRLYDTGELREVVVRRFFGGFVPWTVPGLRVTRAVAEGLASYQQDAATDHLATPSYRYSPATGSSITYYKTALWLHTLERWLGWAHLQPAMSGYFQAWAYRHPQPDDFLSRLPHDVQPALAAFNDDVQRSAVFDYGIEAFSSRADGGGPFRTTVVASRLGDGIFPVEVVTTFDDGTTRTEHWNGVDRRMTYSYETRSRATSSQVDPRRILMLDTHRVNNSRSLRARTSEASTRWSLTWMAWLQDLLLTCASLV